MNKKRLLTIVVFFITTLAVPAFATVFRTSDLTGNWYVYTMEVNPSMPAVYWLWGNKTNSDGVWTTTSGMLSIGLFIKESNVALPGTPLLLLDD